MFLVRPCTAADREEVDRLLKESYYPEEPLTRANGLEADLPGLTRSILPQGHSVVAEAEEGRLVGVALNDQPPQDFPNIYTTSCDDVKFQEMFSFMERESEVLSAAPGALEVRMLVVDADWRHRGVATALLTATRAVAHTSAFSFMKLYCTSAHSSRLMSKLGWRLLYSLPYRSYLEDHPCGMRLPPEPHTTCDLFIDRVEGRPSAHSQVELNNRICINGGLVPSGLLVQN